MCVCVCTYTLSPFSAFEPQGWGPLAARHDDASLLPQKVTCCWGDNLMVTEYNTGEVISPRELGKPKLGGPWVPLRR